jgi:hypothetical protein
MKLQFLFPKYPSQTIDTDFYDSTIEYTTSSLFQYVEDRFNEWFDHNTQDGSPMGKDICGWYYGEGDQPAIFSKTGAIQEGINILIEEALELNKRLITPQDLEKFDIECAFE